MHHLEVNWKDMLQLLERWRKVPLDARQIFLHKSETRNLPAKHYGEALEPLIEAGLLAPLTADSSRVKMPDKVKPFRRMMRASDRHPLFDEPSTRVLINYLSDHFTNEECHRFLDQTYRYYGVNYDELVNHITSASWLNEFLDAADAQNVSYVTNTSDDPGRNRPDLFIKQAHFKKTQQFLRAMMDLTEPLRLCDLRSHCSTMSDTQLHVALSAGVRYLLVYAALGTDDKEPLIGIWPGIAKRLHRPVAKPPKPVKTDKSFGLPILMEDMTVILAACSAQPPRLRQNDRRLFAKAQREIEERLVAVPDWLVAMLPACALENRMERASVYLQALRFVEIKGGEDRGLQLTATKRGLDWLKLDPRRRLRCLMDRFRETAKGKQSRIGPKGSAEVINDWSDEPEEWSSPWWNEMLEFVPADFGLRRGDGKSLGLEAEVTKAFGSLDQDHFYPLDGFIKYHTEQNNPLINKSKGKNPVQFFLGHSSEYGYGYEPYSRSGNQRKLGIEMLEQAWMKALLDFLVERLVVLGGVMLGLREDKVCLKLESPALYYLGLTKDFEYGQDEGATVIIQPNFEVVFLAPSPVLEATIGRFAKRVGKKVGTLFKITRESIFAAAATGMKSKEAIQLLKRASTRDLPANVEHEIRGWFGQCRHIKMTRSVLLHCPDTETAGRVRTAGGKKITPITDTVLEFHDEKQKASLLRKLKELGVFLESD